MEIVKVQNAILFVVPASQKNQNFGATKHKNKNFQLFLKSCFDNPLQNVKTHVCADFGNDSNKLVMEMVVILVI